MSCVICQAVSRTLGRFWPTSDNGSGSDAYSSADKQVSTLLDATGAATISHGPTTGTAEIVFSFAGNPGGSRAGTVKATLTGTWSNESMDYDYREDGGTGEFVSGTVVAQCEILAQVSTDGGSTWGEASWCGAPLGVKHVWTKAITTAPDQLRVKFTVSGERAEHWDNTVQPPVLRAWAEAQGSLDIFAVCLEEG